LVDYFENQAEISLNMSFRFLFEVQAMRQQSSKELLPFAMQTERIKR